MPIQVSPGVAVREIDLTNVVPAVSTSIGGMAGMFAWGPVEEITSIGSENELLSWFGKPDNSNFAHWFTAASFLRYGNHLKVIRSVGTGAFNATTTGGGATLVKNRDDYDNGITPNGNFVAKYAGALGNSIQVSICPASAADAEFTGWTHVGLFDTAPKTSDFASDVGATNDELHIVVVDAGGKITGTKGEVLETFVGVSQIPEAKKTNGATNYYVDVLNNESKYVWWGAHDASLENAGVSYETKLVDASGGNYLEDNLGVAITPSVITGTLSGGADGATPTIGNLQTSLDLFKDAETVDVNLVFSVPGADGADDVAHANYLISLATQRKDVVAFISPPVEDTVGTATPAADVKAFADQLTSSSYAVIDSSALKLYDKYNDTYRWVPACGSVAGLCANTDNIADPWFSPAGYSRGQLLGVTKLAFNPKQADRDTLYKARVNPLVTFPGQGTLLYGDKTAQAKPSAFDRINVRRLFIVLEKAIATAAKFQLFEFNDSFTRAQFRNLVEPFLRDVQGRRGITDFAVVCDETNNTGEVIDTNRFVADIYIKPNRSINFISLNFVATRSGVEFNEIIGQF